MTEIISPDYALAVELTARIEMHISAINSNLFEMCRCLRDVKESKLYKELGYQTFEDYTVDKFDMKRTQAYSYVKIAESFSEDFVRSSEQIGAKKLYALAMLEPEQRTEIIQTTDLENTTVKELKAKIADLEQKNTELKKMDSVRLYSLENCAKQYETALEKTEKLKEKLKKSERATETLRTGFENVRKQKAELEKRLQELENRPVEVVFEKDEAEINALKSKISELEKQLAEKPLVQEQLSDDSANKEAFFAYISAFHDSMKRITRFIDDMVGDSNHQYYIEQTLENIDVYTRKFSQQKRR